MYFASRMQAGRMLASQLHEKYGRRKCAVLALNDGGAVVGAQIAAKLGCVLTMLPAAEILLPREPDAVAGITASGVVSYNHRYSDGELDELVSEYYGYIEQEKLNQIHQLNQLIGRGGTIDKNLLKHHSVIIVSDGLKSGFQVDLAVEFLKPVDTAKLVVAVPFASVTAVDRMHIVADDLYCLNTIHDYMDTNHYYDDNNIPDHQQIIKTIENVVLYWQYQEIAHQSKVEGQPTEGKPVEGQPTEGKPAQPRQT